MSSIHPDSSKPIDSPPAQLGVSSKKEGLPVKPEFPVQGVSDPITVKNSISTYCQKYDIKLPPRNADFGAALLSTGNNVLAEAAKRGEGEVVRHLLETPRRVLAQQKAEKVSQSKLGSAEQTNVEDSHLPDSLVKNLRNNVLFSKIDEFPAVAQDFKQVVAEKESWDTILSTLNDQESLPSFLNNVLTAVEKTPPSEVDKELHLSLAKRVASQGAAGAVIERIDHFAPELEERVTLFQWLFKEGEADVAMDRIEVFNMDSWGEEDWGQCLEAAKNHIRGVDLAKQVPDKFKSKEVKSLIKECEENRVALEKVTGVTWKPVSRVLDPESGGYRITFESKIDFSGVGESEEKRNELFQKMFPAVEAHPDVLPRSMKESHKKRLQSFLESAGFTFQEKREDNKPISQKVSILTLPDVRVIEYHYKIFRNSHPALPEFSIFACDGILSDEDFFQKVLQHNVVCSNDKEYVHDMATHCFSTLDFIMTKPEEYISFRTKWTSMFREAKNHLDEFKEKNNLDLDTYEQLFFMMSLAVDNYSAADSTLGTFIVIEPLESLLRQLLRPDPVLDFYIKNRFGENYKGFEELNKTWQEVLKSTEK